MSSATAGDTLYYRTQPLPPEYAGRVAANFLQKSVEIFRRTGAGVNVPAVVAVSVIKRPLSALRDKPESGDIRLRPPRRVAKIRPFFQNGDGVPLYRKHNPNLMSHFRRHTHITEVLQGGFYGFPYIRGQTHRFIIVIFFSIIRKNGVSFFTIWTMSAASLSMTHGKCSNVISLPKSKILLRGSYLY